MTARPYHVPSRQRFARSLRSASARSGAAPSARPVALGPMHSLNHPTTGRLLRAALLRGPGALEAWEDLTPDLDLDQLDAGTRALLPLVWRNLERLGAPTPRAPLLRGMHRYHAAVGGALLHGLGRALGALTAEGIDTLLLGDAALAVRYYGDVGLCPIRGLEILVRPADAARAGGVLTRLGWRPPLVISPRVVAARQGLVFDDDGGRFYELAWHVFEECPRPGDDDDLWAASEALDLHGPASRVLSPADQLLKVLVDAGKPERRRGPRWVADAVTIIRSGRIDWDRLVAQATRRRVVLHAREALAPLGDCFEPLVPIETLSRLASLPVTGLERLEHRRRGRSWWLGQAQRSWCAYQRRRDAASMPILGLAHYLRDTWGLASVGQLPGAALARLRQGRRATRRGRPGP